MAIDLEYGEKEEKKPKNEKQTRNDRTECKYPVSWRPFYSEITREHAIVLDSSKLATSLRVHYSTEFRNASSPPVMKAARSVTRDCL